MAFVAVLKSYIASIGALTFLVPQSHSRSGNGVCTSIKTSYNMVVDSLSITRPMATDQVATSPAEGLTNVALNSRAKCKLYD